MSWIFDALAEPFKKLKKPKVDITNPPLPDKMAEPVKEINVEATPAPVQQPVQPVQEPEALPKAEITTEDKLQILESNVSNVLNDMHERVSALERWAIKNSK